MIKDEQQETLGLKLTTQRSSKFSSDESENPTTQRSGSEQSDQLQIGLSVARTNRRRQAQIKAKTSVFTSLKRFLFNKLGPK